MRYYAMIDGEQRGPYTLDELTAAGVHPDTYVWCKGMDDWQKAEDVADICRYFRQRIFDMMHGPQGAATALAPKTAVTNDTAKDPYDKVPARFRGIARRAGISPEDFFPGEPEVDTSRPPMPTVFISLLMTLFCFPITGLIAVYYSFKARKAWAESCRRGATDAKDLYTPAERENLRREAHDYERKAKMWIGISFFLGIIVSALVSSHLI